MSYSVQSLNVLLTRDAAMKLRPPNARKLPISISFLEDNVLTGKAAVKALSGLTPEEKERHKLAMARERNKRRQEKISYLREIDSLPTNKHKICYMLRLYNPSVRETAEQDLMMRVDNFLETLGLE